MKNTGFWCGMSAGIVVGAAVGMMVSPGRKTMKTCVGRAVQKMGCAMDSALDSLMRGSK